MWRQFYIISFSLQSTPHIHRPSHVTPQDYSVYILNSTHSHRENINKNNDAYHQMCTLVRSTWRYVDDFHSFYLIKWHVVNNMLILCVRVWNNNEISYRLETLVQIMITTHTHHIRRTTTLSQSSWSPLIIFYLWKAHDFND